MDKDIFDILKKCGLKQELLDNDFTSKRLQRLIQELREYTYYKLGVDYPEGKQAVNEELFRQISEFIQDGNFYYERNDDGTLANRCTSGFDHKIDSMYVDSNGNVIAVEEYYPSEDNIFRSAEKRVREFDKSGIQTSVERTYDMGRKDMAEHYKIVRNPDFVTETVYIYPTEGSFNFYYRTPTKVCQRFCDYTFRDNEHGLLESRQYSIGNYGANSYDLYEFPGRIPVPRSEEDIKTIQSRKRMLLSEALENGLSFYMPRAFSFVNNDFNATMRRVGEEQESYAKKSFMEYALRTGLIRTVTQEDGSISYEINEDMIKVDPRDFICTEIGKSVDDEELSDWMDMPKTGSDMEAERAIKRKFTELEEKYSSVETTKSGLSTREEELAKLQHEEKTISEAETLLDKANGVEK